jgi:hypothetical protein
MADVAVREGQQLIHSFLALRKAVGFVGMALPFALLAVQGTGPGLGSVSQGYYTAGSAVFVASVCAIGIFLLFYRGYDGRDRAASFIAGAAALVVGQVPCGCGSGPPIASLWGWASGYGVSVWPKVHLAAAVLLFVTLALFCLWLFPKSDGPRGANRKKEQRNFVYYTCGALIVACLLAIGVDQLVVPWLGRGGVFVGETIMMLAFGFSWAVKGEGIALLNDKPAAVPPVAPVPA